MLQISQHFRLPQPGRANFCDPWKALHSFAERNIVAKTGGDMPKTDLDAPTQRILSVVEAISAQGPITLVELCAVLPISRAAIWRALDTLRAMGWVRMRAGDSAFELRSDLVARLGAGHVANPLVEQIAPIFETIAAIGFVHVDLGGFVKLGQFRLLESNRKQPQGGFQRALSLVEDDLAIAGQLSLTPPNLVMHLRSYLESAEVEPRRLITSGEHGRTIAKLREKGHFWRDEGRSVALALKDYPGFALRVAIWRQTRANMDRFHEVIRQTLAQHGI
jgi:hypothetical protein